MYWDVLLSKVVFWRMTDTAVNLSIFYIYFTFCSYRYRLITYMTTEKQILALFM